MIANKGEFGFEEMAKIILALVILVTLITLIMLYKDKMLELINKFRDFLMFAT